MKSNPLKCGFVTLIGLPNAGKSSLLNSLVGEELAIVTPKAQTTRQNMRAYLASPTLEAVVTDTPGLQLGSIAINQALTRNSISAIKNTDKKDLITLVVDAAELGRELRDKKQHKIDLIKETLEQNGVKLPLTLPVLPILNKSDLVRHEEHRTEIEQLFQERLLKLSQNPLPIHWVSTKNPSSLSQLIQTIESCLPEGVSGSLFEQDDLTDQNVRDFAAEYVREQCFMQLGAEIPYSIAVQIEEFKSNEPELDHIRAIIHVERDSQKAMVIGRGGSKLKSIGTKSREKIERLTGKKAFLGIKVKVTPHWARDPVWVERFGYGKNTN